MLVFTLVTSGGVELAAGTAGKVEVGSANPGSKFISGVELAAGTSGITGGVEVAGVEVEIGSGPKTAGGVEVDAGTSGTTGAGGSGAGDGAGTDSGEGVGAGVSAIGTEST